MPNATISAIVVLAILCSLCLGTDLFSAKDLWGKLKNDCMKIQDDIAKRTKLGSSSSSSRRNAKYPIDRKLVTELQALIETGPIPKSQRKYVINGWRWHTKSVIRDLKRFSNILVVLNDNINKKLKLKHTNDLSTEEEFAQILSCYEFVYNFNWKSLLRVESEIFVPWLVKLLPNTATPLVEDILSKHSTIKTKTTELGDVCKRLSKQKVDPRRAEREIKEIDNRVQEMIEIAQSIAFSQETFFVPYITSHVNKHDQEYFNRKVVRILGLLDAQVHLVSMWEAIQDNPTEISIFQKEIPRIANSLIPVWRSSLYAPRTKCLTGPLTKGLTS